MNIIKSKIDNNILATMQKRTLYRLPDQTFKKEFDDSVSNSQEFKDVINGERFENNERNRHFQMELSKNEKPFDQEANDHNVEVLQ